MRGHKLLNSDPRSNSGKINLQRACTGQRYISLAQCALYFAHLFDLCQFVKAYCVVVVVVSNGLTQKISKTQVCLRVVSLLSISGSGTHYKSKRTSPTEQHFERFRAVLQGSA